MYSFSIMIMLNFVVFACIVGGQTAIYMTIRASTVEGSTSDSTARDAVIARRLTTVVISDFLCWFPVCLLGALVAVGVYLFGNKIHKIRLVLGWVTV